MDPLAQLLHCIRLDGGLFLEARLTAPWCVLSHIEAEDCRPYIAAPAQVIGYHVVLEGEALVTVDGEPPLTVRAGEIVMLPRNDYHTLAGGCGAAPIDGHTLIRPGANGGLAAIDHGGGGAATKLVCGFLASEDRCNPLIATLPRMLKLDVRQGAARDWVQSSVRFAASELAAGRLGSRELLSRLSELLFVEAVRGYADGLASSDDDRLGWLRGAADPQIGRALAAIHRDLRHSWTPAALAAEVAMSRSVFVERFSTLVGLPPIRYVTAARLQSARMLLEVTRRGIAEVAYSAGYDSEAAFSRAFKREYGLSPAHWRGKADAGSARKPAMPGANANRAPG